MMAPSLLSFSAAALALLFFPLSVHSQGSPLPCPGLYGSSYSDGNRTYDIYCGTDTGATTLTSFQTSSFVTCMTACDNYASCISVTWADANDYCYLKGQYQGVTNSTGVESAVLVAYDTTAAAAAQSTVLACNAINGTRYTDSTGAVYQFTCSANTIASTLATITVNSLQDCMTSCDAKTGCHSFTYNPGSPNYCYLQAAGSPQSAAASNTYGTQISAPTVTASSSAVTYSCPAANGQTITDSSGIQYTIGCASDSSGSGDGGHQVANSFNDCFALCDALSGCEGFVYVGGTNGVGAGSCYLKANQGYLSFSSGSS